MPVFRLALLLVLSALSLRTTGQIKDFKLPYEKFTLDNGLEVVLHEDHSDPIVALATVVHVGSAREKPGKTGFAHFFEHMSFNDSENTPQGANRKLIPEWGGERNGGTWQDGTIYYEVVPKDAFDKILWIDSDRLGFMINTVTPQALEAEKQVVKNEKRENVDNVPYGYTDEIINGSLYPKDHPYSWSVIGSLPDLQAATLADVREFYDQYYGAANATLVIAGDIDIAETKEKVTRWFGEIRRGPDVRPMPPMPVKLDQTKSLSFEDSFAKLPELRMVFPTVQNYHPDTYALDILAELLSGSRKSPLYRVMVEEKKLAPNSFAFQSSSELTGEFTFRIRANAGTSLGDVHAAVQEGLARFEKEGFADAELDRIKAKLETQLYQAIATVLGKAFTLSQDNEFAGDPAYILKSAEKTLAVTREDILRVYNTYLRNRPYVMTSVVPKGQVNLAVANATPATVWQEKVVANVQNENVTRGGEAEVPKTPTKYDRSEPPFGNPPRFRMPAIWTAKAKNGLTAFGIENNEIPLVSIDITVPGGHLRDTQEKAGAANLMAQLLNQGTAKRTPAELEEAIGLLGTTITFSCTQEEFRITANCLARNFEPTLALVQEMILEPRWDAAEFDRLKKALETSLKGAEANAQFIANRNFYKLMYGPEHLFSIPVNGNLQSAATLTLEDLKKLYASSFSPAGASLHIAGAINKDRVTRQVEKLAEAWKSTSTPPLASPPPRPVSPGTVYFIDFPDAKQSVIYVGRLAVSASDPNSDKILFANEILGGGSSGRLFQTLRVEKGYTYGAYSNLGRYKEKGPFFVSSSVRTNATLPSLEIIRDMLKEYGSRFGANEVAITQNKVLKGNTLSYESLGSKLSLLREMSKYGRPATFVEQEQEELLRMKESDFKKVIDQFMKESDMIYLVVGDKATQWEEVKKLKGSAVLLDNAGNPIP